MLFLLRQEPGASMAPRHECNTYLAGGCLTRIPKRFLGISEHSADDYTRTRGCGRKRARGEVDLAARIHHVVIVDAETNSIYT